MNKDLPLMLKSCFILVSTFVMCLSFSPDSYAAVEGVDKTVIKTLSSNESAPDAAGKIKRTRLVQKAGKYPLTRIEETVTTGNGNSSVAAANDGQQAKAIVASREMVGDHIMVTVHAGVTTAQVTALAAKHGCAIRSRIGNTQTYLICFPAPDHNRLPAAIAAMTRESAIVLAAEPDGVVNIFADAKVPALFPTDRSFHLQWNLHNTAQYVGRGHIPDADIDAPEAWDLHTGSRGIKVAVIDTGINYRHPDLAGNMWVNPGEIPGNGIDDDLNGFPDDVHGRDFHNNDSNPDDDNSHGSGVASVIGASHNNTVVDAGNGNMAGICPNVSLVAVKTHSFQGYGFDSDVVSGIDYAIRIRVDVMNCSWGSTVDVFSIRSAIKRASDAGILVVCAAGNSANSNDNPGTRIYPASYYEYPNVISVAASTGGDTIAAFSNFGPSTIEIAAPGLDILAANRYDSNESVPKYGFRDGTSFAAPHVAGACALIKSYTGLSANLVKARLLYGADVVPTLSNKVAFNRRLNLYKALKSPVPGGSVSVSPGVVATGKPLTITVSGGPGLPTDLVAMYPVGVPRTPDWVMKWHYLNGLNTPPVNGLTSATITMVVPQQLKGWYQILFMSAQRDIYAVSSRFEVTDTGIPPHGVTITSPVNNSIFTALTDITLNADVSDREGVPNRVDFYSGTTRIGIALATPYGMIWKGVAAGSYSLTAKATNSSGVVTSQAVTITVRASGASPASTANGATFVSQSVPATMTAGQSYPVSVTMRNSGTTTWTAAAAYGLGSQSTQDNTKWGLSRVSLAAGDAIAAGQSKTFAFTAKAPMTAGAHSFQWKMVQDGVMWFGTLSINVAVTVNPVGGVPPQTFKASTDFSGTQGSHQWRYLDSTGASLVYDAVAKTWKGSESYLWIWADGCHPGSSRDVVRRWTAPQAGSISITGSVRDSDVRGGDGVIAIIRKNGVELWRTTIANGNATGVNFSLTNSVAAGNTIDFVINRIGSNGYDSTTFDPTIILTTTTPGATGLAAVPIGVG
jgi:subtilisin family serine protease